MLNSMNFVEAWAAWILSSSFCVIDENIQFYHLQILVKTLTPQASTMLLDTTCGFGTGVVEIVMKEVNGVDWEKAIMVRVHCVTTVK